MERDDDLEESSLDFEIDSDDETSIGEAIDKAFEEVTGDSSKESTSEEHDDNSDSSKDVNKETKGNSRENTEEGLETFEPPSTFTKEEKEFFKTLPANVQKELSRIENSRQSYFSRAENQVRNLVDRYGEIEKVLEPYKREFALSNVTPGRFLEQMLETQKWLNTDPKSALSWLANRYGITPYDFEEKEAPKTDPQIEALKREIESLKSVKTEVQESQTRAFTDYLSKEFQSVGVERDQSGNLLRPELENFLKEGEFINLLKYNLQNTSFQNPRNSLDKTYKQYLASYPEKRVVGPATAPEKLDRAKKASRSLSTSPGGTGQHVKPLAKNFSDAFDLAWAELGGD